MIKLPDFTKCVQFQNLFLKMGIREIKLSPLPENRFIRTIREIRTVTVPNTEQIKFRERIKTSAVEIDPKQIHVDPKTGLLEVNGVKCCIYIKNQNKPYYNIPEKTSTYKFHLCECNIIQNMIAQGKKEKYVATSREDGYFPVNAQGESPAREVLLRLELCKSCIEKLKQKDMYKEPFSLEEFFSKYKSELKRTYTREEIVICQERYSPNHKEIADAYKEQVHYCCQICGVDCSSARTCLHFHHKDGNGQNNSPDNVIVLCAFCHSEQFSHGHMKRRFSSEIEKAKQLQKEQGIINV